MIYWDYDGHSVKSAAKKAASKAKIAAAAAKAAASKSGSSSNSNNSSSSGNSSTCPEWLDWNGDGKVDTKEEMKTFDSNHDARADWLQKDTADEWAYTPTTGWAKPTNNITLEDSILTLTGALATDYSTGTLSTSRINQIEKKGKSTAKQFLSAILRSGYDYWDTYLHETYRLEDYTFYEKYLELYNKTKTAEEETKAFFEKFGIVVTYTQYFSELNNMNGCTYYTLPYNAGGALVFTIIDEAMNQQPGIENIPDMLGIYANQRKEKDIVYEQLNYIANSDYRYFVSSVVRDDYIDLISERQQELKKKPLISYGNTREEKAIYNQAVNNYLSLIKNMHINYRQSYANFTSSLKAIENKYR